MSSSMRRGAGDYQHEKLLKLLFLFLQDTDEEHGLSRVQIEHRLESEGITITRQTFYEDIRKLNDFLLKSGSTLNVASMRRAQSSYSRISTQYYITGRNITTGDIILLIKAVQSAKFLTAKDSAALIKKVIGLASVHDRNMLTAASDVNGRVKSSSSCDLSETAEVIQRNMNRHLIRIRYRSQNETSKTKTHTLLPLDLAWNNEYLYLIAHDVDDKEIKIKSYRLDRIESCKQDQSGKTVDIDKIPYERNAYMNAQFGMFTGEITYVTLLIHKSLEKIVRERFGSSVTIYPGNGSEYLEARTGVVISPLFYGWVMSFGERMKITYPKSAVDEIKQYIISNAKMYDIDLR